MYGGRERPKVIFSPEPPLFWSVVNGMHDNLDKVEESDQKFLFPVVPIDYEFNFNKGC